MILWWTYQQLRASSPQARLAVIAKLAESDTPDSLEPLLFALKDKEPEVRCAAISALGKIQDPRVMEPLLQRLRDPAASVRSLAVEILGRRGDKQTVTALTALLRDADPTVRAAASRSLEWLGWKPGDDAQRVQQILASGNLTQIVTLGAKAVAPLLELMRSGPPEKQLAAVNALGEIHDPRVPSAMLEALKKSDPALRTAALGILERLGDPSTFEGVVRLLKDGNATVRGAAIETSVRCGGKRAVPSLLQALKDPSWEVRHIAVKALGSLADAAAVDGLCGMLNDSDRDVRESAIVSLGKIGDRRAIQFLVPMLFDPETVLRVSATASLRRIDRKWEKDESIQLILPQLKAALDHQDYWVKHSAVKLFQQLGIDPDSVGVETDSVPETTVEAAPEHPAFSILADLLFDLDRDLRLAAADAFGRLRDRNAQPILAAAVHDEDRFVQQAAQAALAALN